MTNLEKIFEFLHQISNLKSTLRWPILPSGRQESTAEHTWRLALMTFLFTEELKLDLDVTHAIKIALVHDLAEAITGDFNSWDVAQGKVSKSDKQKQEARAMKKFQAALPEKLGQEIFDLWQEYEDHQTPEARFVKALDKIELLTQFVESGYTIMDDGIDHTATYAHGAIKDFPEIKSAYKIVEDKLKEEYKKGGWEWKKNYNIS